ncbi:MAG: biopolymer transporter ExbD, partial [Tidjanibacter sp.]|nr:biopolymer transporter ExbD [Tidjanibacter sp.]
MAKKKKTPEVNAGSMADIAFLLLIFFLVATTMNVDSGINRTLPPWVDEENQDAPPIKERNILKVFVSAYDQLM